MRQLLATFAGQMEERLQAKDEDYGTDGWMQSDCDSARLHRRLQEKMKELGVAFQELNPNTAHAACVDIANFAMMISTRLQNR